MYENDYTFIIFITLFVLAEVKSRAVSANKKCCLGGRKCDL